MPNAVGKVNLYPIYYSVAEWGRLLLRHGDGGGKFDYNVPSLNCFVFINVGVDLKHNMKFFRFGEKMIPFPQFGKHVVVWVCGGFWVVSG